MWKLIRKVENFTRKPEDANVFVKREEQFFTLSSKRKIHIMQNILNPNFDIYQRTSTKELCVFDRGHECFILESDGSLDVFMNQVLLEHQNSPK